MKRIGNLFEKIVGLDNLLEAFHATQKGKAAFQMLGSARGSCIVARIDFRS